MNKVILKGRLTDNPQLSNTGTGVEYCNFSIAVDRYVGKDKESETDFIPCKAWRQSAVFINKYFAKGKEILVEGSIRFDKYEKDGEKRTSASVSVDHVWFCGGKSDTKPSMDINPENNVNSFSVAAASNDFTEVGTDDDLPF